MADAAAPSAADSSVATLQRRVAELEAQLAAERQQRNAERAARIRLQRAGRAERLGAGAATAADEQQPVALNARAIGTLHSCFSRRNGTPRQPALVPAARSQLTLRRGVPSDALSGLEGFSHAWVLYVFHANTNLHVPDERFKARVAVPRLDGGTRGVFATRTPHRPVPLGLSLGRLLSVDARRGVVTFQGLDLVDNTPVLDIKPYVPFCDAPPPADVFAPDWVAPVACGDVAAEPLRVTAVDVPPEAAAALAAAYEAAEVARRSEWHQQRASGHQPPPPALYPIAAEFIQLVTQVLSLDIRSLRQRTGAPERQLPDYRVVLCCVEVEYSIDAQRRVRVLGARVALPEEAWTAQQDAAAALNATTLDDGAEEEEESAGRAC